MRKNKYPNGYIPKIQYWTNKLNVALLYENMEMISKANAKLTYFINKQCALQSETFA